MSNLQTPAGQWTGRSALALAACGGLLGASLAAALLAGLAADRPVPIVAGALATALAALWAGALVMVQVGRGQRPRPSESATTITHLEHATDEPRMRARDVLIIVENLQQLVFRTDTSGVLTYVNRRWEQVTGLARHQIVGRPLAELFQSGDHERIVAMLQGNVPHERDPALVRMPIGERLLTLDLSIAPLRDVQGRISGHAGHAVDVTGRQLARERLQDQLDFMTRLVEISPTPLFAKDTQKCFTEVNRAWLDMMGLPLNHVLGRTWESLVGLSLDKVDASDDHVLETGELVSFEMELVTPNFRSRDTLVTKARLNRGDGHAAGIVGSVVDVTPYRQAERATRAARDASVQAARAKIEFERSFLSMAAHELRTPLTSLRLQSELLVGAHLPELRRQYSGEVLASVDGISHVLEQLMILSRVDGMKYSELDIVDVDLQATYFKVMSQLQHEAAEHDLTMKAHLRGQHVDGVEFGVYTLMRNLLHNAILYTPRGGRIVIGAASLPDGLLLTVDDSGPGIPPEQRQRAFDRFHRLGQLKVKGSGLGLSIVKTIASLHGATVALETSPLGGLRVAVTFPAQMPKVPQFLDSGLAPLESLDQG